MDDVKTIDGLPVVSQHYLRRRAVARKKALNDLQRTATKNYDSDSRHARTELLDFGLTTSDHLAIYKRGRWDARYYVVIDNARNLA